MVSPSACPPPTQGRDPSVSPTPQQIPHSLCWSLDPSASPLMSWTVVPWCSQSRDPPSVSPTPQQLPHSVSQCMAPHLMSGRLPQCPQAWDPPPPGPSVSPGEAETPLSSWGPLSVTGAETLLLSGHGPRRREGGGPRSTASPALRRRRSGGGGGEGRPRRPCRAVPCRPRPRSAPPRSGWDQPPPRPFIPGLNLGCARVAASRPPRPGRVSSALRNWLESARARVIRWGGRLAAPRRPPSRPAVPWRWATPSCPPSPPSPAPAARKPSTKWVSAPPAPTPPTPPTPSRAEAGAARCTGGRRCRGPASPQTHHRPPRTHPLPQPTTSNLLPFLSSPEVEVRPRGQDPRRHLGRPLPSQRGWRSQQRAGFYPFHGQRRLRPGSGWGGLSPRPRGERRFLPDKPIPGMLQCPGAGQPPRPTTPASCRRWSAPRWTPTTALLATSTGGSSWHPASGARSSLRTLSPNPTWTIMDRSWVWCPRLAQRSSRRATRPAWWPTSSPGWPAPPKSPGQRPPRWAPMISWWMTATRRWCAPRPCPSSKATTRPPASTTRRPISSTRTPPSSAFLRTTCPYNPPLPEACSPLLPPLWSCWTPNQKEDVGPGHGRGRPLTRAPTQVVGRPTPRVRTWRLTSGRTQVNTAACLHPEIRCLLVVIAACIKQYFNPVVS